MLPVACLPVCGILMGIGYILAPAAMAGEVQGFTAGGLAYSIGLFLIKAGGALIDNMSWLFAVGVAVGMADDSDGTAGLAGLVSMYMITTLLSPGAVAGITGHEAAPAFGKIVNQFVGILSGLIGSACYNKYKTVKLPDALAFFSGKRAVAIFTAIYSIVAALVLFVVWPLVYGGLVALGEAFIGMGAVGAGIYAFFNRLLIPFGLHHALNSVFWFDVAGISDLSNFWGNTGVYGQTGMYMTGFFPFMMFGLPGAALAMYTCARPENKKAVGSLLLSAAISSAVTGITEPLEFAFLFVAPPLYVIHCAFAGLSYMLMHMLNVGIGMTFSGGFLDFFLFGILQGNTKTSWLHVIPVGILYFIVYFIVFRVMILKFNYQTPGHEKDNAVPVNNADNKSQQILDGLGGLENISDLSCCATRLRVTLHRPSKLNKEKLLATGAAAVVANGDGVQVVYGPEVTVIHARLQDYIAQIIPASSSTADNSAAVPTTSAEVSNPAVSAEAKDSDNLSVADAITDIVYAPCNGTVIPLKEINDGVFSEGYIGEGLAIEPVDGSFYAPFDCSVAMVFDTHHAIALHTANDTELILHVGLDTVKLNGQHLEVFVQEGQKIQKGDLILRADLEGIQSAGCRTVTPVVITGAGGAESVELLKTGPVHIGDAVLKVHY